MTESKKPKPRPVKRPCMKDGFAARPSELRPRSSKKSSLRRVTCPGCGLVYRTNRATDLCMECEEKSLKAP